MVTIVTALFDGKETYLGWNDGITLGDTSIESTSNPWLFFGNWALGITGESVQQDVLSLNLKDLEGAGEDAVVVADVIRRILNEYGHYSDDNNASASYKIWCILVNKKGQIWDLDERLALTAIPTNLSLIHI